MTVLLTKWPLRQALTESIRNLIDTKAAPSINEALASQMRAKDPSTIPQFSLADANIVKGNLRSISEPTICVWGTRWSNLEGDELIGGAVDKLYTTICLKLPYCGDSDPEDYELCSEIVSAALYAVFWKGAQNHIVPVNPKTGNNTLPSQPDGSPTGFSDCYIYDAIARNEPVKTANETQYIQVWDFKHHAAFFFPMDRPDNVG